MGGIFIGIDSGTQGTKVLAIDSESRKVLAGGYAEYKLLSNDAGGREQHPEWWFDAMVKAYQAAVRESGIDTAAVRAIGVSGQQHGFVPLNKKGEVIRPAKLWCDTETAAEADELTEKLGGTERVTELIGNAVAAGFTASKVLWLKKHEPENYSQISTILLPHDYLNYRLTGEKVSEYGDASGTAYFDIRSRSWSEQVLRAIDGDRNLLDTLPVLIESIKPAGTVLPQIAELLDIPKDTLVSSGGGDNMMAAIGTGNVTSGSVTASFGTSGTIYCFSKKPVAEAGGELAAFCSSDGNWLPLVCTMNVTVSTEVTRKLWNRTVEELNKMAEKAPAGAEGLLLIPYFNGERTPPQPKAKAVLYGLDTKNYTEENLSRAAMEGAAFGMRYALDVMKRNGIEPKQIKLVGGGAKSRLWRQIASDIFHCPVISPVITEAGALGAALQALWCYENFHGRKQTLKSITDTYLRLDHSSSAEPNPANAAFYDEKYQKYLFLNEKLSDLWK